MRGVLCKCKAHTKNPAASEVLGRITVWATLSWGNSIRQLRRQGKPCPWHL